MDDLMMLADSCSSQVGAPAEIPIRPICKRCRRGIFVVSVATADTLPVYAHWDPSFDQISNSEFHIVEPFVVPLIGAMRAQ
jgi:hypothetical protein